MRGDGLKVEHYARIKSDVIILQIVYHRIYHSIFRIFMLKISYKVQPRLKQLNKIIGGRVAIPHEEYLTPNNTRTRSISSTKFKHYRARTLIFKNSFFPRTIPVWNRTPDSVISDLEIEGQIVTTQD